MKVNYDNKLIGTAIKDILVGEVFLTDRKSTKERGLYMKIDSNSGLVKRGYNTCYAINIETGQIRSFIYNAPVTKVVAEVIFPKE